MDAAMKVNIAGLGKASAVLTGTQLAVTGTFEGMLSPATTAQIRRGTLTGVRGPAILDLKVTSAPGGSVSGAFDLDANQLESLRKGLLYIQIASEKAPEGNLWGWLLP
jgi:CHRD domain